MAIREAISPFKLSSLGQLTVESDSRNEKSWASNKSSRPWMMEATLSVAYKSARDGGYIG